MKTNAALSPLKTILKFFFFKLIPLIILTLGHIRFVGWMEQVYFFEKSVSPWGAAVILTLIPLGLIAGLSFRSLKQMWPNSRANVVGWGIVLLLVGTFGSRTIMQLTGYIRFEHDSRALASLEDIYKAQNEFKSKHQNYATLQELVEARLIRPSLLSAEGTRGYKYSASDLTATTFSIHADRLKHGMGNRDFLITESGELRYIETRLKGTVPRGLGEKLYSIEKE